MAKRARKSFEQYLSESHERNPELAALYEETRQEVKLAMKLAQVRRDSGMSQRDLAEKTGIAQPMISRVERGAEVPTLATLLRLAPALNVRVVIAPSGVTVEPVMPAASVELPVQQPVVNTLSYFDNLVMRMRTGFEVSGTVQIYTGGVEGAPGSGIQASRDFIVQDNPVADLTKYGIGSFVTTPRVIEAGTKAESLSASRDASNPRQPTTLAS